MRPSRLQLAFDRPLRAAVVSFWLLSSAIVVFAATRGLSTLLVLVPVFGLFAIGTARRWRWVLIADLLLLGAQPIGVVGSAIELFSRGGGDKGAQLRALGLDPFYGVLLNLVVALIGATLFGWALVRLRAPTR